MEEISESGTVFEQVLLGPVVDRTTVVQSRELSLVRLSRLDRRFAWLVTVAPALGFVAALVMMYFGYPPGWVGLLAWLSMHLIALVGVEVGFHRHFSHRSFQTIPAIRWLLAVMGSTAFQGPVIWWAATHRRHHQFSDQCGDPHSPHSFATHDNPKLLRGLFHAHLGWLFVRDSTRKLGWERYAPDLYGDPLVFSVHRVYFYWLAAGFLLPGLIAGVVTLSWENAVLGVLWGGFVRVFVMNHVFYWCINSVTHAFGTRPFKTRDKSTNSFLLAIPTLGQSWHNNHHAFPASAIMSMRWWQFDPGGLLIRFLERLGIVWDVRYPSRELIESKIVRGDDTSIYQNSGDKHDQAEC